MTRVRSTSLVVSLSLLVAARTLVAQQPGTAPFPVQAAVRVQPDTVHVGDPFIIEIGVRAPPGASIFFPEGPDTASVIQALDPTRVETSNDTNSVVSRASYRLAAWDTGVQLVQIADVTVRLGTVLRKVQIGMQQVYVQSVLPADTTLRVPKPERPIFDFGVIPWWVWALIAAVALLLLLLWWWLRRKRRPAPVVVIDPYDRATREFSRIEALRLVEAGERGRYSALMVEVLRDYLAARYAEAKLSLTSTELLYALRTERTVPQDSLARLLADTDLIKFARRPVNSERARELGAEARKIVEREHEAVTTPPGSPVVPPERAPEKAA